MVNNKQTKTKNNAKRLLGAYNLAVALSESATVYVFATQDNKSLFLLVLATVFCIDAAQRFGKAFIK